MNYSEALDYLESLGQFGIKLDMDRIKQLLLVLGNPEKKIKTVHVGGTNGKGSVVSYIASIFCDAGLKTGTFTSPHLVRYNERIAINGEDIPDADFADIIGRVAKEADALVEKEACEHPTQFEVLTAAAFLYFAEQEVDYAVIEVGLGGLWDSTNLIKPEVSVITNVSMEHTAVLGDTIERIAMQKAGIIKEKIPVVTGASGDSLPPIQVFAAFKQAPIYSYGYSFHGEEKESSWEGQTFTLKAGSNYASDYSVQLPGEHQIVNASLAVVAAKIVSKSDDRIKEENLHKGLAAAKWPGRLEVVKKDPLTIVDGAHNPAGAEVLRKALDKYCGDKKVHFVMGMMHDKDVKSVMKTLLKEGDTLCTVTADLGERAAKPEDLAELALEATDGKVKAEVFALAVKDVEDVEDIDAVEEIEVAADESKISVTSEAVLIKEEQALYQSLNAAVKRAEELAKEDGGAVCICGSLYMIGSFYSAK